MIKLLNVEKLYKSKRKYKTSRMLKVLTIITALSPTLIGCSPKTNKQEKYTSQEWSTIENVEVDINYNNWTPEIKNKEAITFTYDNTFYASVPITNESNFHTEIKNLNGYIYSIYLDKQIDIPKANEDEKIVVNVDYKDSTLEAHTEKLEKDNTK